MSTPTTTTDRKRPNRVRRAARSAVVAGAVFAVRCYQGMVRPLLGGSCRFLPTCSEYAIEALQVHGLWRGGRLTLRRLMSCRPGGGGGIDPVPPAENEGSDEDADRRKPRGDAGA